MIKRNRVFLTEFKFWLLTIFHSPHFENGVNEAMYPQIVPVNILICHENIHQS